MSDHKLPDFILIGGSKCGSTSLFEYLSCHPDVSPCKLKEPHYFTKKWDKGLNWYKSLYRQGGKLKFEGSTSYSNYPWYKETPKRISNLLPSVKIVYIVRHPISRLISQVHHNMIMGRLDIKEVNGSEFWMQRGGRYINLSMYYLQIEQYLNYFGRDQLHVLTLEELSSNPDIVLGELAEFLGLAPEFFKEKKNYVRYNVSGEREKYRKGIIHKVLRLLYKNGMYRSTKSKSKEIIPRPVLSRESIEFIWSIIGEDIGQFEDFMGRDIGYVAGSSSMKDKRASIKT